MESYPSVIPINGSSFTEIIHSDTYEYIDPITKSNLAGRAVFITGGNRGIGKAIAISFARARASFIALGCNDGFGNIEVEIQMIAKAAGHGQLELHCVQLDVTDSASVAAAAAKVQALAPKLDILINNAGFMTPALPVADANETEWWKTFEVNLKGIFLMSKYFTPLLTKSLDGLRTVVNINSYAAHNLRVNASAYGTSKWAVLKFMEFLLVEESSHGLLGYSVHPGGIMTQLAEAMPVETHTGLADKPELAGDTIAYLTQSRREWLAGRFLSCNWDMEELMKREAEIVSGDKLKVRLVV